MGARCFPQGQPGRGKQHARTEMKGSPGSNCALVGWGK